MYETYSNIFNRLGLEFRAVEADTGSIGGNASHAFHVLAKSGEDAIAFSTDGDYAANVDLAPTLPVKNSSNNFTQSLEKIATPGQHTIEEVSAFLNVSSKQVVKTLIVKSDTDSLSALVLRGDHELNAVKAQKLDGVADPLEFASDKEIEQSLGCKIGSLGPLHLNCPVLIDHAAFALTDFVCGANEDGHHYQGVNWERDFAKFNKLASKDIRKIVEGDASPDGKGTVLIKRGIEVGHIFQLGDKYSKALKASVLGQDGKEQIVTMGCYGIGVTRIVAAAIEQNFDEQGIIWPQSIAPFDISLIPINRKKSEQVTATCERLYSELQKIGVEVLFDDRDLRAGMLFADHELIGIPHRIVVSERALEKREGEIEYKGRQDQQAQQIPIENIVSFLQDKIMVH